MCVCSSRSSFPLTIILLLSFWHRREGGKRGKEDFEGFSFNGCSVDFSADFLSLLLPPSTSSTLAALIFPSVLGAAAAVASPLLTHSFFSPPSKHLTLGVWPRKKQPESGEEEEDVESEGWMGKRRKGGDRRRRRRDLQRATNTRGKKEERGGGNKFAFIGNNFPPSFLPAIPLPPKLHTGGIRSNKTLEVQTITQIAAAAGVREGGERTLVSLAL